MGIEQVVQELSQHTEQTIEAKALLKENARLRKKLAQQESGWELIRSVLEDIYKRPSDLHVHPPKKSRKKHQEVAVVHLTDIHYGKETPTYDIATCERRLAKLCTAVSEITELRRAAAGVNECLILLGGDNIEGEGIFPGQAWETEVDIISQMVKEGPEILANVILSLQNTYPKIRVVGVPGNHGRQHRFNSQRHNADSVFYEIIRKIINDGRIDWDLPLDRDKGRQWYARFNITGRHEGMLIHGDQIRGQLGFPWYGFGKKLAGWKTAPDTCGFQFLFSGHFHTHAAFELHDSLVLSTGSVESTNCYALENMAASGDPKQRLCFFNESRGLLADYPILLGDV